MIEIGCDRDIAEVCDVDDRRAQLRNSLTLGGIDYIEVYADGVTLCAHLFGAPPRDLTLRNVVIDGGVRIRGVMPVSVAFHDHGNGDLCLQVRVNKTGDFSRYCVCLVTPDRSEVECSSEAIPAVARKAAPGIDPRFACGEFWFRRDRRAASDCLPPACPPADKGPLPAINYLARDYPSFRKLLLDRLAQTMPTWKERLAPDLGITIIEVLAYVADQLSYELDATATEAFLRTARRRISVRRHARLVDYWMHEGCNARAWITIETDTDIIEGHRLGDLVFAALPSNPTAQVSGLVDLQSLLKIPGAVVFEAAWWRAATNPDATIQLFAGHSEIHFYTWSRRECCLPAGSTRATLLDEPRTKASSPVVSASEHGEMLPPLVEEEDQGPPRVLQLRKDDVLIFEEIRGCATGSTADADPARRHAVRLVRAEPAVDLLTGSKIVEIEWHREDALPFDLRLSLRTAAPDCAPVAAAVARGNVVLADHGIKVSGSNIWPVLVETTDTCCVCDGASTIAIKRPVPLAFTLPAGPITHAEPLSVESASATAILAQDPRKAVPSILLRAMQKQEVRARHLFFRVADPNDQDADKEAEAKARATLARIKAGEDFTPLAKELTDDPRGKQDGGDLGYFTEDQMVPEFSEVAFNLDKGQVSDPVKTAFGWHIIKIEDKRKRHEEWQPVRDLLGSGPDDPHFVAEIDDDGAAHVRFGDGLYGRRPSVGWNFSADYRVGNGPLGNVGHDAIRLFALRSGYFSGGRVRVRNPIAAVGGVAPESIEDVKIYAPHAFGRILERAVAAADYAEMAADDARLQGAFAEFVWTGSWYETAVAIDPLERTELIDIKDAARARLERARRIGHDFRLVDAKRVALDIEVFICVAPHYLRSDVEREARDILSNRGLPDGTRGLFHPDEWKFGADVSGSRIISALQAIDGVEYVELTRFARLYADDAAARETLANSMIPIDADEVAILDGDPNYPEHGNLGLTMRGGR